MRLAAKMAVMAGMLTAGMVFSCPQPGLAQVPAADDPTSAEEPVGFLARREKHVADFVANVAGYDFDQCSAALHGPTSVEPGEAVNLLFDVGMGTSDNFVPSLRFLQVLSDRRVAKLYAWLQEMPADEAARQASTLFDEKLAIHQTAFVHAGEALRRHMRGEPKLPEWAEEDLPREYRSPSNNVHALSAALFLCAAFCPPEVVLEKRDRWYELITPLQAEIYGDRELAGIAMQASMWALPEKFLLNIYAVTYDRHGCGPVERIVEAVGKRRADAEPRFRQVWFCAWDTPGHSIVHSPPHDRIPNFDETSALAQFWMARRWGSLAGNETRQDEVLAAARKLVEECARAQRDQ